VISHLPKIAEEARTARRDQIIAAAAGCFARAGYHATTMADIAEAAGVSKGTPYLYFPSKEALFIALYQEWDRAVAGVTRICAATHSTRSWISPRIKSSGRSSCGCVLQVRVG
jgi:AcrR family transcriptional regulator